jgi:hypothetical protein
MSDNKLSRKDQNAILKARYEEDKARKKEEKERKRALRAKSKSSSSGETEAEAEARTAVHAAEEQFPEAPFPEVPTYELPGAVPAPAKKEKTDKRAKKQAISGDDRAKSEKVRRGALPAEVKAMMLERKVVLSQWRSLKIEPKDAVVRLTALSATDASGDTWRLLPRPGGTALVRTTTDGVTSVVEPPVRRRKGVAVAAAVLFGILAGAAIWSSFNPVTDGGDKSGETAISTTLSVPTTSETTQGGR